MKKGRGLHVDFQLMFDGCFGRSLDQCEKTSILRILRTKERENEITESRLNRSK